MAKEIFVGRKVPLDIFRDSLYATMEEAGSDKKPRKRRRSDDTFSPRVFLLYGEPGLGRTSLLSQCAMVVQDVEAETKKNSKSFRFDFNTFEFASTILEFSPAKLIDSMHAELTLSKHALENHFVEYTHIARRLNHVRQQIAAVYAEEKHCEPIQEPDAKIQQTQRVQSDISNAAELCYSGMGILCRDADFLSSLRLSKKSSEDDIELFENAEYRLAKALVNGLVGLSTSMPVILVFDNLERLGTKTETWLRSVFFARLFGRKNRIIVIASCKDRVIREYRNLFGEELVYGIPLADCTLTCKDIAALCDVMHLNLKRDAIEKIEQATEGIPLVVRDLLFHVNDGRELDECLAIVNSQTGFENKLEAMVNHYLMKTPDRALLAHIIHVAMLNDVDGKIIASLWNCSYADVNEEFIELSDRFPFFTHKTMHEAMRRQIRCVCMKRLLPEENELLEDVALIVLDCASRTISLYADELRQLSTVIPAVDKRHKDERYEHALRGYFNSLMWGQKDEVKRILPGCFCECFLYNQALAAKVLAVILEFSPVLSPDDIAYVTLFSQTLQNVASRPFWTTGLIVDEEETLYSVLYDAESLLSDSQKALLNMLRANNEFRKSQFTKAYEHLQKCVPFVKESESLKLTVVNGFETIGNAFFSTLHFEEAASAFDVVTTLQPDRYCAWYGLGRSYGILNRHEEAKNVFVKAISINPENANVWCALGDEQFACSYFVDAIASYTRCTEISVHREDCWLGLAHSYESTNQISEAVVAYEKACSIHPGNADALYQMGNAQNLLGQTKKAIDNLQKALEIIPDFHKAAMALGTILFTQGKYEESLQAYERAFAVSPKDETVLMCVGRAACFAVNDKRAMQVLTIAVECNPQNAEAYELLGMVYERSASFESAANAYTRAINIQPENARVFHRLGQVYSSLSLYEDALESYTKAINIDADFIDAWYSMGITYMILLRPHDALIPFEKVSALSPTLSSIWFDLGIAYHKVGDCEKAITCFEKVIDLSSDSYDAWYNIALCQKEMAQFDKAVQSFQKAGSLDPQREDPWQNLGKIYEMNHSYEDAIVAYTKAIELSPSHYDSWYGLGDAHKACGNYSEAAVAYRNALQLKETIDALIHGGQCSYYSNDYENAIDLLARARTMETENTDVIYTLALSYHAIGNFSKAVELYKHVLKNAPAMQNAKMNCALALHAINAFDEALDLYNEIIMEQPENSDAWFHCGKAYQEIGKWEDAVNAFLKVQTIAPDRNDTWFYQGMAYLANEKYEEALGSFTKAIEHDPASAEVWSHYAQSLFYSGKIDESIVAYTKSIEIEPDNVFSLGNISMVYLTLGNYTKAIEFGLLALDKKPDELWIQVNLALATLQTLNFEHARREFEKVIALAKEPKDLLSSLAPLKAFVAHNPELTIAHEILIRMQEAWKKMRG